MQSTNRTTPWLGSTLCLAVLVVLNTWAVEYCAGEPSSSEASQDSGVLEKAANALNAAQQSADLRKRIRVVDLAGRPVPGATVSVWAVRSAQGHGPWTPGSASRGEPPTVTTDAEGRATIPFPRYSNPAEKVTMDSLTCRVKHPDFATTNYNDVNVRPEAIGEEAEIKIAPGARITITPHAEGVAFDRQRVYVTWSSPTGGYAVEEKDDGRYVLPRLPAGTELIRVAYLPDDGRAMFSEVLAELLADGDDLQREVELHPGITVVGRVDDLVPRPVQNGILSAMTIEATGDLHNKLSWRTRADIESDGTFRIDDVPTNSELQIIGLCDAYMVTSGDPPDFVSERERKASKSFSFPQVFHVGETETEITLSMTPTVECVVRVVDQESSPIAGAKVDFGPNVKWWNGGSQIYCHPRFTMKEILVERDLRLIHERQLQPSRFQAVTDESGEAVVRNLPPKSLTFSIGAEGYEVPIDGNSRRRRVDLHAGGRHELTVTMQPRSPKRLGDLPQALLDACQIIGTGGVLVKPLPSANDKQ